MPKTPVTSVAFGFTRSTVIIRDLYNAPKFLSDPMPGDNIPSARFQPKYIELTFIDGSFLKRIRLCGYNPRHTADRFNKVRVITGGDTYWNNVGPRHWLQKIIDAEIKRLVVLDELPKLTKREILKSCEPWDLRGVLKTRHRVNLAESLDRDLILREATTIVSYRDPQPEEEKAAK